jgi:hypothetical protein
MAAEDTWLSSRDFGYVDFQIMSKSVHYFLRTNSDPKLMTLGAIMFNDDLSDAQCKALLSRLAECAFPFQCAHGRPSMIPLVDLGMFHGQRITDEYGDVPSPEHFNLAFKNWRQRKSALTAGPFPTTGRAEPRPGG